MAIQKIELQDGKYTHILDEDNGGQKALRHGKRWRDLTGDGLVLALAQRIYELERREGYEVDEQEE